MNRYTQRDRERHKRNRANSRRIGDSSFVSLPNNFLRSETLENLSPSASKLLFQMLRQLGKDNNGDLQASWSVLKDRGWKSKATLNKALRELRKAGVITQTRQGGRNLCSLYALTFVAIDECLDKSGYSKHNAKPSTRPLGLWHPDRIEHRDLINDTPANNAESKQQNA